MLALPLRVASDGLLRRVTPEAAVTQLVAILASLERGAWAGCREAGFERGATMGSTAVALHNDRLAATLHDLGLDWISLRITGVDPATGELTIEATYRLGPTPGQLILKA